LEKGVETTLPHSSKIGRSLVALSQLFLIPILFVAIDERRGGSCLRPETTHHMLLSRPTYLPSTLGLKLTRLPGSTTTRPQIQVSSLHPATLPTTPCSPRAKRRYIHKYKHKHKHNHNHNSRQDHTISTNHSPTISTQLTTIITIIGLATVQLLPRSSPTTTPVIYLHSSTRHSPHTTIAIHNSP
jgi:hypothetical protein